MNDDTLLERFVSTFHVGNEMVVYPSDLRGGVLPSTLDDGIDDSEWARQTWKPARVTTDRSVLIKVAAKLPGRLPPLYEQLILSYRWLDIELKDILRLFGNTTGIESLLSKMTVDRAFVKVLFPLGLIPFGLAPNESYDPICFATKRRRPDGDCPIVRVEHESVLCNQKLGECRDVFDSFRSLAGAVIQRLTPNSS